MGKDIPIIGKKFFKTWSLPVCCPSEILVNLDYPWDLWTAAYTAVWQQSYPKKQSFADCFFSLDTGAELSLLGVLSCCMLVAATPFSPAFTISPEITDDARLSHYL